MHNLISEADCNRFDLFFQLGLDVGTQLTAWSVSPVHLLYSKSLVCYWTVQFSVIFMSLYIYIHILFPINSCANTSSKS